MKFKVGDRVRAVKSCTGNTLIINKTGTIKLFAGNGDLGVEFDENICGHDLHVWGRCKDGHGWYCPDDILEPAYENIKVGKKYLVKCFGKENGNVIEITKITGSEVYYRTLVGVNEHVNMFQIGSEFHKGLTSYIDNKIVITTDGKTTTAKMYDGKKFIKSAKAVCSPDDEFDFNLGATIALERLTGHVHGQLESTVEEKPKFNFDGASFKEVAELIGSMTTLVDKLDSFGKTR